MEISRVVMHVVAVENNENNEPTVANDRYQRVLHAFTHNTILTNHKSTLPNEKQTGIADRDYVSAALIVTKPHPRWR
jgi:hypothetical protein